MKKYVKVVSVVLMLMLMMAVVATPVLANNANVVLGNDFSPGDMTNHIDQSGAGGIAVIGGGIIGILQVVGIVLSVIVLIILGIKYMMGSAEEKAEYKKTLIPYIIGAVLIFAAAALAQVVYDFVIGLQP
ncbi:MAG: pilin [Oscillospiraceae bacterium]|nr:pilin [Oscillospiraceae bacterium]